MPRPRPDGSGAPQFALVAASSSTPLWRGGLPSRARRDSYGSLPARGGRSSMKLSMMNPVLDGPTQRQNPSGGPKSLLVHSMRRFGTSEALLGQSVGEFGSS